MVSLNPGLTLTCPEVYPCQNNNPVLERSIINKPYMVIFQLIKFNTTWLFTKKTNLSILPEIDKNCFYMFLPWLFPLRIHPKKKLHVRPAHR